MSAGGDEAAGQVATAIDELTSRTHVDTIRDLVSESGAAVALLLTAIVALVWTNSPWRASYDALWSTELAISLGGAQLRLDLVHWINDGLMTIFFLEIGLEIRREFDLGELRERSRLAVPVIAAIGGMVVPVLVFFALVRGGPEAHGWATVMSTDTALALGVLALAGRRSSRRLRVFLLTLVIVDDVAAIAVIGLFYTTHLQPVALGVAATLLVLMAALRRRGVDRPPVYAILGVAIWLATFESGVHPTVAGVAIGVLTSAYPPSREALGEAARMARAFRQQPGPELAAAATRGIATALSPNERLQHAIHPWTSYLIVPLFALANAGIDLGGGVLQEAIRSPVTAGIVLGLVVGKPVGIVLGAWVATRRRLGGLPLAVGWPSLIAGSTVCGIGFTMSLLIAELGYTGTLLDDAKVGILLASSIAAVGSYAMFQVIGLLPRDLLRRAEARAAPPLADLVVPVDPRVDHVRGGTNPAVTLVEYADYECPPCGRVAPIINQILERSGAHLAHVMRHLPLADVHPDAALAAEAAEAAGAQGRFWEMHERLFANQDKLTFGDLVDHARAIGLDVERFADALEAGTYRSRVLRDIASADASGVAGTPTLFINDVRYRGPIDLPSLEGALRKAGLLARTREQIALEGEPG